jgi:hypothetical protein
VTDLTAWMQEVKQPLLDIEEEKRRAGRTAVTQVEKPRPAVAVLQKEVP